MAADRRRWRGRRRDVRAGTGQGLRAVRTSLRYGENTLEPARIVHGELRSNGKNKTRLVLEFSYGLCN